jgi:hypothetical protein
MAGLAAAYVQPACVVVVGSAKGFGEGVVSLRDGDEVNVVGHKAIAEEADGVSGAVVGEGEEVDAAVAVVKEDGFLVVPALGDVMGDSWDYGSCDARH